MKEVRPGSIVWLGFFLTLFAIVWVGMYAVYTSLPFLKSGAEVIADAKFSLLARATNPGAGPDSIKIFFFGNSTTLAGLRPSAFQAALGSGRKVIAVNFGLPGESEFLPILRAALSSGNIPNIVALSIPWAAALKAPGPLSFIQRDEDIASTLFPFRTLPRDAASFVLLSRGHFLQRYKQAAAETTNMLKEQGWYFIAAQSRYANNELPADFSAPTDRPKEFKATQVPQQSFDRAELESLAKAYGFKILLVPRNVRAGVSAPPPFFQETRAVIISDNPEEVVLGPDYWTYPPNYFSDPVHLNLVGAAQYSGDMARLLANWIER